MKKDPKPIVYRPWHPEAYEVADAAAIQALQRGEATADQQRRAIKWIVNALCRTYDTQYFPDSPRDTDLAIGKRHVGLQLVKLSNIKLGLIKQDQEETENG